VTKAKAATRTYRCGQCGRKLKQEHWIYSGHTGSRYCYPGEGCWNNNRKGK